MQLDTTKEMEFSKVTDRILQAIIQNCYRPYYLSKKQKESSDYLDDFMKKFESTLSETQRKNFNRLLSIQNDISSTDMIYDILYGMKVQLALQELINNPLKAIDFYDSKGANTAEMYKFLEISERKNNDE